MHYTLISKNYEEFTLLPSQPGAAPINFKGAKLACCALPGDDVTIIQPSAGEDDEMNGGASATPPKLKIKRRAQYPPLIGIVDLKSKNIYGFTAKNAPIVIFYPYDTRFPPFRVGCSKPRTENLLVSVKFEMWDKKDNLPRGGITDYLGTAGDLNAELLALGLFRNPWPAKYEVLPDLSAAKMHPMRTLLEGHRVSVHIDPEGCRDIDDALSFSRLPDGSWEIAIHIADVAHRVEPGDEYDVFARKNGSSVYDTNGKVLRPMLPVHLSEDACSLKKGKMRQTIALVFNWNPATRSLSNQRFVETFAFVSHSATYENVASVLPPEIYQCLGEIATHLGANPVDTHTWVEVLMILYNVEAAKILPTTYGLLRCQPPSKAPLTLLAHPDLKFIGLEQAKYEIKDDAAAAAQTHNSLGNILYTHATSPIRRYADLVNQRAIKAHIRGIPVQPHNSSPQLLAYHLNMREKHIKQGERAILFLEALHRTKRTAVDAIVIDIDVAKQKTRLYVPEWKRLVTYKKLSEAPINSIVKLEFFFDSSQVRWENKLVFKVSPIN